MFFSILHRAILMELAKVFAMSLLGITGILVLGGIVAEASQQGLGPAQILAIVPLLVPATLPYTIPATTLFATCVVYGRLAADNEITAIKSAGVNVLKVVWPAVLLGAVMSGVTLSLYHSFIPSTHDLMRSLFLSDVEEFLYTLLKKDGQIKQPGLNYAIFVRRVQGRRLQEAIFKRKDAKGKPDIIARAREAELRVDISAAEVLVHMRHAWVLNEGGDKACVYFEDKVWQVPLPPANSIRVRKARSMTWPEIQGRRAELAGEQEKLTTEIAAVMAQTLLQQPPSSLAQHVHNMGEMLRTKESEMRQMNTELQMRPAVALGCLCFVLVGCPVGIWFSRSDYLSAFITCFLPIVFLYYPMLLCGTNLAKEGKVHPAAALWAANAAMALIALVLYRRLLKN